MPSAPFTAEALAIALPNLTGFEFIKSGSFKSVYRVNTASGSEEVLKIIRLPQDVSSDEARLLRDQEFGRAQREVELLGRIDCAFIVRLGTIAPNVMTIGGEPCVTYTEEMLPGRDLETVIAARQHPTAEEIKSLLASLIVAIRALWTDHRTVHRDIKPANIFATELAGRPYVLLDLGIAYNVNERGLTANPAHIPATPLYMAPEMLDPNFRETLSYRADLYAAGVTAFEFAAGGIHPLAQTGDNVMKTLTRVLHQEPLRLASVRPDLPVRLTALIDQLNKKNPALRPGNLAIILNALR
ncbi:MAG: protein kinase [Verrucomicrobia bacterium]|nr:protein kinase [Verrucomicrobiota bacterium]